MYRLTPPRLTFSPWYAWASRDQIDGWRYPGVYLVAITNAQLSGKAPRWADVCYIGMSNSKGGLCQRWAQFYNAVRGKKGHSGGNTIYLHLGHYERWRKKLFVAAMPVACDREQPGPKDFIKMGWVAFLEYKAFSEYCRRFPRRRKPRYNTH